MGSAIGSIIGGGTNIVGQAITGRAQSKAIAAQGQIAKKQFEFSASVDEANADIIKASTGRATETMRKEGEKEISAQRARIGATGLTAESFGLITAESVENLEQDILDFSLERDVDVFNLETSARFKRLQGLAAERGAATEAELTKVGTAFNILGSGAKTAGSFVGSK
jgi:hypothetical protein